MPSDTNISAGESITLTVQPKMVSAPASYDETIVFYGSNETVATVRCTVVFSRQSGGGASSRP